MAAGAPTILIVEDNSLSRKMVRAALRREHYQVLEAGNGQEAIEAATRHKPDLILQDLLLPDMEGLELVRRLRALPDAQEIPIIALSGLVSKVEQANSLKAGFTDYLFKPVEPTHLLETVRTYLIPRE